MCVQAREKLSDVAATIASELTEPRRRMKFFFERRITKCWLKDDRTKMDIQYTVEATVSHEKFTFHLYVTQYVYSITVTANLFEK